MGLDRTPEAEKYYNKIRVGMLMGTSPLANSLGFQNVIRGYMSEGYWMNYPNVPEDEKESLFEKVGGSTATVT